MRIGVPPSFNNQQLRGMYPWIQVLADCRCFPVTVHTMGISYGTVYPKNVRHYLAINLRASS